MNPSHTLLLLVVLVGAVVARLADGYDSDRKHHLTQDHQIEGNVLANRTIYCMVGPKYPDLREYAATAGFSVYSTIQEALDKCNIYKYKPAHGYRKDEMDYIRGKSRNVEIVLMPLEIRDTGIVPAVYDIGNGNLTIPKDVNILVISSIPVFKKFVTIVGSGIKHERERMGAFGLYSVQFKLTGSLFASIIHFYAVSIINNDFCTGYKAESDPEPYVNIGIIKDDAETDVLVKARIGDKTLDTPTSVAKIVHVNYLNTAIPSSEFVGHTAQFINNSFFNDAKLVGNAGVCNFILATAD